MWVGGGGRCGRVRGFGYLCGLSSLLVGGNVWEDEACTGFGGEF